MTIPIDLYIYDNPRGWCMKMKPLIGPASIVPRSAPAESLSAAWMGRGIPLWREIKIG